MPAESRRLRRRVRRRDRRFLVAAACAALVGTPVAVVLTSSSGAGDRAGCVSRIEAGFMGGQTRTLCGTQAAALCRSEAGRDASLAADCRRAGFTRP